MKTPSEEEIEAHRCYQSTFRSRQATSCWRLMVTVAVLLTVCEIFFAYDRSIFIRLVVVASHICEITRNSEKIRTYSNSRSSKVIDLGANRKCTCNMHTVFEILTHKARKQLVFPTPPLFDAPAQGDPSEFRDETYPAKTRGIWPLYGENCMILTSTVYLQPVVTDGRTDGRTDRRSGDSI